MAEVLYHSDITNKHRIVIEKLVPSNIIRIVRVGFKILHHPTLKLKDYPFERLEIAIKTFEAWRKIYQKLKTSNEIKDEIRRGAWISTQRPPIICGPHCTYWRFLSKDEVICDNPELKEQYQNMGSKGPGLRTGQICHDGKHINDRSD